MPSRSSVVSPQRIRVNPAPCLHPRARFPHARNTRSVISPFTVTPRLASRVSHHASRVDVGAVHTPSSLAVAVVARVVRRGHALSITTRVGARAGAAVAWNFAETDPPLANIVVVALVVDANIFVVVE